MKSIHSSRTCVAQGGVQAPEELVSSSCLWGGWAHPGTQGSSPTSAWGCSPSGVGTGQWEKGSVKGVLWQQRVVKVLGVTDRSSPALLHTAKLKPTFRKIFLWSLVPLHVADIPSCHGEYKPGRVRDKIHPIQKNIKEKLKYSEILPCYLSNLDVFITYEG